MLDQRLNVVEVTLKVTVCGTDSPDLMANTVLELLRGYIGADPFEDAGKTCSIILVKSLGTQKSNLEITDKQLKELQ